MARNYQIKQIDDVNYELHPVKLNTQPIGLVPVRVINTLDDIKSMVDERQIDVKQACQDFTYGLTVRLQRMARDAASGEKFTDALFGKMCNQLDADELKQYAGRFDALRLEMKRRWELEKNDGEADAEHIWSELL